MYKGTKRREQKQRWKTAKEDQEEEAKRRRKQRMLLKRQFYQDWMVILHKKNINTTLRAFHASLLKSDTHCLANHLPSFDLCFLMRAFLSSLF